MKCFELTCDGRARSGIPADAHQVLDDRIINGGRILNAGVKFCPLPGMSDEKHPISPVLDSEEYSYMFCTAHLLRPGDQESDLVPVEGSILLRFSFRTYTCDPEYGDASRLVTWNREHGLFLCIPGRTAVRNPETGEVFVLNDRRLERHPDPKRLHLEQSRDFTLRRMSGIAPFLLA